ncbi:MAG: bifunctional metallophosphatase/5'-nucleotidase [Pseudomonadota bacterium]
MKLRPSNNWLTGALLCGGLLLLTNCGGSSSSNTGGSSNSNTGVNLSGTAATGAPIVAGRVDIKCAGASIYSGTTATSNSGDWSAFIADASLPCIVEVFDGKRKLHSIAQGNGQGVISNVAVTPLTEQLVGQLSADTSAFFTEFDTTAASNLTSTRIKAAQNAVFAALSANGITVPSSVINLLNAPVVAPTNTPQSGNDYDDLLELVKITPVTVKVIAMNDFHGNIEPTSTNNGGQVILPDSANPAGVKATVGGAAYLSSAIKNLKAKNANNIVVGAGDMIGAAPFSSQITHNEAAVDILNQIGLEITTVGNHEFDRGLTELQRMQNGGCYPADGNFGIVGSDTCLNNGTFSGAQYKYLAANATNTSTNKTLFPATYIKQFGLVSVGFIGLTLKGTPDLVDATRTSGVRFDEESAVINQYAATLKRNNGVSAVVVLIHQGGATTASTFNDKSCPGLNGEIVTIMDKLSADVDVIVSGHTHQEYVCEYQGKAANKKFLLSQTGFYGSAVTEIDLTLLNGGGVKSYSANNIPVLRKDDPANANLPAVYAPLAVDKDPTIDTAVNRYVNLSIALKTKIVGSITADIKRALLPTASTPTRDETAEGAAGDMIADAYLESGKSASAEIAMINPGGVRSDLIFGTTGQVTYGDLATVVPFANTLVTLDLTGAQLRRVLENQWEAPNWAAKTGVNGNGRMLQISKGFTYTWNFSIPGNAPVGTGNRVVSMSLNGTPIDLSKTYRVIVPSFLASGGDNFTAFTSGSNLSNIGVLDLDALISYFNAHSPIVPPAPRIIRLN